MGARAWRPGPAATPGTRPRKLPRPAVAVVDSGGAAECAHDGTLPDFAGTQPGGRTTGESRGTVADPIPVPGVETAGPRSMPGPPT